MFKFYEKCFFGFAMAAVFLVAGCQVVSAQSSGAATTAVVSAQVVATVEIYSAEIISQQGNQFKLSFDFFNQKGVQPGIKYAVQLLKIDADGRQTIVDEFVYPEVLDLKEGETKKMAISYTAPEYLQGEFLLYLASKNSSSLPLAFSNLGKIKLNGSGEFVEILPETCFLTIETSATATIACQAINHLSQDIKAMAQFQTFLGASFGREVAVESAKQNEAVELKAKQQTEISFSLPKSAIPQTYEAQFWLMADNKIVSNKAIFRYTVAGQSATFENIIFDKEFYKKGDTAQIQFLWFSAGHQPAGQISFIIKDQQGQPCSAIINQSLNQQTNFLTVAAPITKDCVLPKIEATIQDQAGHILDSKTLTMSARPATTTSLSGLYSRYQKIIVLAMVVLILLLALIFMIIRKKKLGKSGFLFFILGFVICFNFLPFSEVKALTVSIGQTQCPAAISPPCVVTGGEVYYFTLTANLNKSSYAPGEQAAITGSINLRTDSYHITLQGFNYYAQLTTGGTKNYLTSNTSLTAGNYSFSVNANAPTSPGSYSAAFSGSYKVCFDSACDMSWSFDNIGGLGRIPYTVTAPACIPLGGSTCSTLANCCTAPSPIADTCQGGKCCISSPSITCSSNNQCCSGYCNAQGNCGCVADGYACPVSPGYCCSYCNNQTNKCGVTSCAIDGLTCPTSGVCCSFCNSKNKCGPDSSTCTNECSPFGQKQCTGNSSYRTCGNYDTDACLEWSSSASCQTNETCSGDGNCSWLGAGPEIWGVSAIPDPVIIEEGGKPVTFVINWYMDGDLAQGHICRTNSIVNGYCTGGTWCTTDWKGNFADDVTKCSYAPLPTDVGVNNYYAFICNQSNQCSSSIFHTWTAKVEPVSLGYISLQEKIGEVPLKLNLISEIDARLSEIDNRKPLKYLDPFYEVPYIPINTPIQIIKVFWNRLNQPMAAADLVWPNSPRASTVMVTTQAGVRAWKKHELSCVFEDGLCKHGEDCCSGYCWFYGQGYCRCGGGSFFCYKNSECCSGICSSNHCACIPAGGSIPYYNGTCATGYGSLCCSGQCNQSTNVCQ